MSAPAPNSGTVERFSRSFPCVACDGHPELPRGKGERCHGFVGSDGLYFRCSRIEFAGAIEAGDDGLFVHRTAGPCNCGVTHREASAASPTRRAPQTTRRGTKGPTVHLTRERLKRAAEFSADGKPVTEEYEYPDENGVLRLIVFRIDLGDGDKTFRQGRPEGDGFVLNSKGVDLVPFHLRELRAAIDAGDTVYVVEGEKDVLAVEDAGFPATCNPMGSGKDLTAYAKHFKGADLVRIVADRDEVGRKHAQAWAELLRPIAKSVEIVEPVEGKDAYDALVTHELGIEDAFTECEKRTESGNSECNSAPREESDPESPLTATDLVSPKSWPFFLGGDADGSAEHAFVIEDLIHAETMAMIVGRQGSLKTPLVMDMAAHVGQGIPYQGLPTTKGCTIYIAAEGSGAIGKRMAGIYAEHPSLPPDAIVAITQPVALNRESEAGEFAEFLARSVVPKLSMPVRMLVFDTMAKSIPGDSDSDDDTISALEKSARLIANRVSKTNEDGFVPASVLIHHPRKNDDEYRGSGSIGGNFDTIIVISKTDAEKLEDRLYEVSLDKLKDGRDDQRWAYRATLVHVGTTPKGKENFAPVVRYIDDAEMLTVRAEAKTKGRQLSKNSKHLVELIVRIETRDGRSEVPRNVLSKSGFLAHVTEQNWDSSVPVHGIHLSSLQDAVYSEDPEVGRSPDGQRTIPDKCRKRWERKREALISSAAAWACDGWLWLAGNNERTGDGR